LRSFRKYYYIVFFFLLYGSVHAQKQHNNWYFGNSVGLNFNVNPPVALSNGKGNSVEGCATVSDINGNLLFYCNGTSVLNRQHEVMVNGSSIAGDPSSTSNILIIPLPGNDSIYYLFSIGAGGQGLKGFRYSIINIKRQSGLGEVTSKNNLIADDCYEKMAAVRHCNKKDVWITVRVWETDEYRTYRLTASGFNAFPVVSNTGLVVGGYVNNGIGALKFSIDGTKLAAAHSFQNDVVELMNFDNTSGVISNTVLFKPNVIAPIYTGVYGVEFSPNSNLLYVSTNNSDTDPSTLYQFDITSMDAATILASKQVIAQNSPWFGGALQLAVDKKIYYALWRDTAISVIENPDIYGPGCNFRFNKIFLSNIINEPVQFGLPSLIAGDLDGQFVPYDFSRLPGDCDRLDIAFQINRLSGIDSVLWDFGDGNQSTLLAPVHTYTTPGNYTVKLIVYNVNCSGLFDNITHTYDFRIFNATNFLPKDSSFCVINNFTIRGNITAQKYLWNTGAVSEIISVSQPGIYWLQLENDGCVVRDSIELFIKPTATVSLGNDTSVCTSKPVTISADEDGLQYLWNNGATTKSIIVDKPGIFWIEVSSPAKCNSSDTIQVIWGDCDLYIPTAFSPNGDGVNDLFGPVNGINASRYAMKIYNRFGQVVFSSDDQFYKWDGKFKNKPAPVGLYPWILNYLNKNGYPQTEKGTVLLIR
jgi:gliding motility-associated-like protein